MIGTLAPDVRVDDADAAAALGERDREVQRHGRPPTPPLPALTAMTFFTPGTACCLPSEPTASRTRAHPHIRAADPGTCITAARA
jgi:hypothetical protein